jgi:hypothetical protein
MVWPAESRVRDFDGVSASYRAAAQAVSGLLLPVGDGWRTAWKLDSTLTLYGPDGFHPSMNATYLAALVIYERMSGRSAVGLPNRLVLKTGPITIPAVVAATLQQAAADVTKRQPRSSRRRTDLTRSPVPHPRLCRGR